MENNRTHKSSGQHGVDRKNVHTYTSSPYVVKKVNQARETLEKFPPPIPGVTKTK